MESFHKGWPQAQPAPSTAGSIQASLSGLHELRQASGAPWKEATFGEKTGESQLRACHRQAAGCSLHPVFGCPDYATEGHMELLERGLVCQRLC